ncbi:MAG: hypothetical protein E7199_03640 [Schwartzia succinivorans]|nr:hypothetical protein [Schwartzia succinivorans]
MTTSVLYRHRSLGDAGFPFYFDYGRDGFQTDKKTPPKTIFSQIGIKFFLQGPRRHPEVMAGAFDFIGAGASSNSGALL